MYHALASILSTGEYFTSRDAGLSRMHAGSGLHYLPAVSSAELTRNPEQGMFAARSILKPKLKSQATEAQQHLSSNDLVSWRCLQKSGAGPVESQSSENAC